MKSTRKLIPAIAMLLVSAVVLSSASYAWFTMSKDVEAQNMKLTITAPTNLLISNVSNTGYGSTTNLTDKGLISDLTGHVVTELYPASSWDGNTFTAITQTSNDGVPTADTKYYHQETAYAAGVTNHSINDMGFYKDYIVYLKTTGDKYVTVAINTDTDITKVTADTSTDEEATKCVRMAVVGQQRIGESTTDWFAGKTTNPGGAYLTDATGTSTEKFFADSATKKITTKNIVGQTGCFTANNSDSGLVTPVVGPMKYTAASTSWSGYEGEADANLADGTTAIITVEPKEKVTAVLIRVWFEGQSDFCSSDIAKAEVTLNLGFKTIAESKTDPAV